MECSSQNPSLRFSRNRSSFPFITSNKSIRFIDPKPRANRADLCQDIHSSRCTPASAEETRIQNRPLELARRSDFGPGHHSRVSGRSDRTNPHEERVRNSRDIGDSRGRACSSEEETLIGNRLLRLERRSDFGPGRLFRVSGRSDRTNPREERVRNSRDIHDSRGRACSSEEETQIQNRLLRLAQRSNSALPVLVGA